MTDTRLNVYLVCNAKYHDTNFARLEPLKLLAEHEDVWVRVAESYMDIDAIKASRLLITYTCDLCPSVAEQEGLAEFLEGGGRWFALHGTNGLLEFTDGGELDTPDRAPRLMRLLGSRFVAHPAIQQLAIRVRDPEHPLMQGIDEFEVEDEPYYCEYSGSIHTLLEADYSAPSEGFARADFGTEQGPHPQMYVHPVGAGEVLYLTLGHSRGKYDLQPFVDVAPVQRCAWESPMYYELLRRGIRWGIGTHEVRGHS